MQEEKLTNVINNKDNSNKINKILMMISGLMVYLE